MRISFWILAIAGFASAGGTPDWKPAEQLAQEGKHAEAAVLYAEACGTAEKKGDLLALQAIVRSLRTHLSGARDAREVWNALMAGMDGKRGTAFMSAPLLARKLLLGATLAGDARYLREAAEVTRLHGRQRHSGKCAKAMASYAAGLVAVRGDKKKEGVAALEKALATMVAEGWSDLAAHVGVELAATYLALHREGAALAEKDEDAIAAWGKAATKAMENVAGLYGKGTDTSRFYRLSKLVRARLKDAPRAVLAPYARVEAIHIGPRKVSAAGGAGGAGAPGAAAGQVQVSPVGAALKRYSKKKPLFTVKRGKSGFAFRQGFDRGFKHTQPYKHGVKHFQAGGVTLRFWGHGVNVAVVDVRGGDGMPGNSSEPSAFQLFYRLAKGETWGVTKKGVVTIK